MDSKLVFIILLAVIENDATRCDINRCVCKNEARRLVNECDDPLLNNCHPNATCFDLNFDFACTCNTGFTGNGTSCLELCPDVPCTGENRECYRGDSCFCTPGFHELNGTCVESCTKYGTLYIDYIGAELLCNPSQTVGVIIPECKSICSSWPGCLSTQLNTNTGLCHINMCDPATDGATFRPAADNFIVSVRNCD